MGIMAMASRAVDFGSRFQGRQIAHEWFEWFQYFSKILVGMAQANRKCKMFLKLTRDAKNDLTFGVISYMVSALKK